MLGENIQLKIMLKFIGVELREGTYQDKPFKNYRLHLISDSKILAGTQTSTVKCSVKTAQAICLNHKLSKIEDLVGTECNQLYYDTYKNFVDFI